jgi:ribosomal protein S18 acetylase RimI-like enzyme
MSKEIVSESHKKDFPKSSMYQLCDVNESNIKQLRVLNIATLPVRYTEKFYKELISNYSSEYLKYATWNGFVVAGVCARVESSELTERRKLYIMTINVLAPYRNRGIATELLNFVSEKASKDPLIDEIYLHVQTSNLDAKEFYLSRGFSEVEIIRNYYKNIDPPDCFLLRRQIPR